MPSSIPIKTARAAALALFGLAPLGALAEDRGAPPVLELAPCVVDGLESAAACGQLEVPESRTDDGSDRRISLSVMVLRATGATRAADALLVLVGGPGQAATSLAAPIAAEHAHSLPHRDIVLVDQRGTGGSHRLACASAMGTDPERRLGPAYTGPEIERCREELSRTADLSAYTTADAVEDLEAVRQALGYDTVTLDGGSYGSRVALRYMQRFPERVRAAVLSGVSPASYRNPLPHARAAQAALDRLFLDCAADPACRSAYPDLRSDFEILLGQLDEGPVRVPVPDPDTGEIHEAPLSRAIFTSRLHLLLLSTDLSAHVPRLIHSAASGDWTPFTGIAARFAQAIIDQIDFGMQLSVMCAEDVPGLDRDEAAAKTEGTFLGDSLVASALEDCGRWVRGRVPADFLEPVTARVPTLILSGTLDAATPPKHAESVARHLPESRHLVLPATGHIKGGACIGEIVARFVETARVDDLPVGCVQDLARPPFAVPETGEDE